MAPGFKFCTNTSALAMIAASSALASARARSSTTDSLPRLSHTKYALWPSPVIEVCAPHSVCSPPPCGEGLGVGVVVAARDASANSDPHPARLRSASAGDPPHKGEG